MLDLGRRLATAGHGCAEIESEAHPDVKVCQVWTDTWMKRDGKWQIVAAQDNRVDCK
jgi:hypothetical protein